MEQKISLFTAILININIIIGSAFFLGAQGILQKSGALSPFTWIIWGLILLPMVLIFSEFTKLYPLAGGIYVYSHKALGSLWGFLSGWGFFIGTIAGNAIIIYAFTKGIYSLLLKTTLEKIGITDLYLTIILIILFSILNLANINFLEKAQRTFTTLKIIPILFVIICSIFLFNGTNITQSPINFSGFLGSIPLVIFAYHGFECCCAITHQIKDGEKAAAKAILISFGIIMAIYALTQFSFLSIYGINTTNPFLEIMPKLTNNSFLINIGNIIIQSAILSSFLGGFYGMFYVNNWVLFAIAQDKNLPFSEKIISLNKYGMPWLCVLIQSITTIIFILITQNQDYLIEMSVFGVVISYLLSAIAFITLFYGKKNPQKIILGILASLSNLYFLYICFDDLAKAGFKNIVPFLLILIFGFLLKKLATK